MRLKNRSTASISKNNLLYVPGQRHDSDSTCSKRAVISKPLVKFKFPMITYFSTIEILLSSLYRKKAFTRLICLYLSDTSLFSQLYFSTAYACKSLIYNRRWS